MIALLLKKYWLEALLGVALLATGWYVYGEIKDWQAFTKKAGEDAARVTELEALVAQRDEALVQWQARQAEWDKKQSDAIALAAQQDIELAAARRAAETNRRNYREALKQLEAADAACAARRVPAAADRLLGQ